MTAEVDDGFFQLFERRIFVRGEAYYDAGKVDPPVMIAENLWHTVFAGMTTIKWTFVCAMAK